MASPPLQAEAFKRWLTTAARECGAHSAACLRLDNPLLLRRIAANNREVAAWLAAGGHAQMDYLERMFPARADPGATFPFARSVIVVSFTNSWGESSAGHPFPAPLGGSPVGYISAYAREADYHLTGHQILAALQQKLGNPLQQAVAAVDTRPVYETLFATLGGLGVIGSNGLLRTPALGTRVFVACLFVDLLLPEVIHELPMPFACTSCRACLANCPTGAIAAERAIAAGRCISYLTIEKKTPLTPAEATTVGDWLFGCDCCTAVCPPVAADRRIPVDLDWLLRSSAAEIRRTLKGNATAYAGVSRLRRNAVVVLNNQKTDRALELLSWVRQNSGSQLVCQQIDELCGPT